MVSQNVNEYGTQNNDQLIHRIVSGPRDPDAPFFFDGDTFGLIYSLSNDIKAAIAKRAVPDQPLCVCTVNRAYVAAAMIAALSGGPKLLLPFAHTLETLEDAQRKMPYRFALVDEDRPLPAGIEPLFVQGLTGGPVAKQASEFRRLETPWLYLFTGGSTGTPQLWSKTPENLLSEAFFLAETFKISADDKILATVPANHIYGLLYSVLLPLVTGAAVGRNTPSYPKEIAHGLAETKASVFISIPAHYRALKESPVGRHHLRMAFSSAGPLSEEEDRAFFANTGIPVTEIYGSTETGGIAYRKRAEAQVSLTTFSCVDVKIEKDQLWVRSDFLSEELPKNEDGFFQTADRAAPEGTTGFHLLGRSDGIVKVGGKRVDLMQIQELLKGASGVRDAYVFSLPVDSGRENEILALIEGELDEEQLRKSALTGLEAYAQPRRVRIVERIPVSLSGKHDRKAIEKLFQKAPR
jgi:acyl-coenzyme A synthetase/AMP-(fatty) acid ligase